MPTLRSAVPILPARDPGGSAEWYRSHLGFHVRHAEREYAIAARDGVEIHFWGPSGIEPAASDTMLRLEASGIRELYEHCSRAQLVHPNAPLERKPWGTEEFAIVDCDGNLVTFFARLPAGGST